MTEFGGLLFCLESSRTLGAEVARQLGMTLASHEERAFEHGEHKSRPLENVRDRDVYVIGSLAGDDQQSANDKLCRLLFFIGALKEASARSVTAVVPYLCYSRKDRQTKSRDPVTTRYVAQLFEAVGTDRVMVLDVHNLAAFQNAFRCYTDHLEATSLFVEHAAELLHERAPVVVSPDIGGMKRAERFRRLLTDRLDRPVESAVAEKHRSSGVVSGGGQVIGAVEGKVALVIDDIISSGGTMLRVAGMLMNQGALEVHLLATHGLFTAQAATLFGSSDVSSVTITNSVESQPKQPGAKLVVLECGGLLAEAIACIDQGQSIAQLLSLDD